MGEKAQCGLWGYGRMKRGGKKSFRIGCEIFFLAANLMVILLIGRRESLWIDRSLSGHGREAVSQVEAVMENYVHSFKLFAHMLAGQIKDHPDPDEIWDYLKQADSRLLEIEGDTFDGLYMYYEGRYLYSWDTPYSVYEGTGYDVTERPWYRDAAAGAGRIVFTPPYMSYANHYILSTVSQLQPDGETVFAYDIRLGDIQEVVRSLQAYENEELLVFDDNGTVIGSLNEDYLGGSLYASPEETGRSIEEAKAALAAAEESGALDGQLEKLKARVEAALAFDHFHRSLGDGVSDLLGQDGTVLRVNAGGRSCYGYLHRGQSLHTLILVPTASMLKATVSVWLVPLLLVELFLIYGIGRAVQWQKNQELRDAYVQLGQTQKRLEIALMAAQKAAAIDHLTGLMNFKSFENGVTDALEAMEPGDCGILIMMDGDHFKAVNDNYGHMVGDEVIKLTAQMMIGRIRTVDLASRLHGEEFSIFIANTADFSVAQRIVEDINQTLKAEAARRNMPSITLSAGAVAARRGDSYAALAKAADEALYRAKEGHNGGFEAAGL